MNIVHITAHMGGGAGKAIAGMMRACEKYRDINQTLFLLEKPEKLDYIELCKKDGIEIYEYGEKEDGFERLKKADVILLNWWQHPKMAEFLAHFPEIPVRIILWCHVNGCTYPYLPYSLVKQMDKVFFTTAYSTENELWSESEQQIVQKKSAIVRGMGEFRPENIKEKKDYRTKEHFTIGYIGTIQYGKLHPDYLEYCEAVKRKIPEVKFLMIGDYEEDFQREVKEHGLADCFVFTGYVKDVYAYMEEMDVFGYLLSPSNYATTENVLLEAMAYGLPVVVYQNKPIEYVIEKKDAGIFVKNPIEYAEKINQLKESEKLRKYFGKCARKLVLETCSMEKNTEVFMNEVKKVCELKKTKREFSLVYGKTPYEWFLSCTGADRGIFSEKLLFYSEQERERFFQTCKPIYKARTKSSLQHFAHYFPQDRELFLLSECAKNAATPGENHTPLAQALPLIAPYLVQIFPSYACNFKCEYCVHSLEAEKRGVLSEEIFMDMRLYKKAIDDMKHAGWKLKMLRFAAIGEPLLHPEIAEMVAYAADAQIAQRVDIVTNASLLTEKLSNALIEAGLSRLRISLEGLSAKEYYTHAKVKIDYEKFVENIRYFYSHCKNTTVYIKIIDYMVKEPEKKKIFYETFRSICHSLAIEHLTPTVEAIDYNHISGGMKTDKPQNGEILLESNICPQPFYMMQINPDGNIVPCCSMRYPILLGSIKKKSVEEIWLGEDYNEFRKKLLSGVKKTNEVCAACKLYQYDLHKEDRLDEMAQQLIKKYG